MDCVLHTTPCPELTTTASARVARFLADELNIQLIAGKYTHEDLKNMYTFDKVFYVNSMGMFAKAPFRKFMQEVVRKCRKVIYVQNDYTIHPISQTQKVFRARGWSHDFPFTVGPVLWTTVPDFIVKPEDSYVNWNRLTYQPVDMVAAANRRPGVLYWGSYRAGRVKSFQKYFEQSLYPVHLAMHPKIFNKFAVHDMDNCLQPVQQWKRPEEISTYQATLYIEDEHQHDQFHSPPNRVYEAMSAGVALFIDLPCVSTLEKGGFRVNPDWVVNSARDLYEKLPRAYEFALAQRSLWGSDHVEATRRDVRAAYAKLV